MTHEQLEAALADGGRLARKVVDEILEKVNRDSQVLTPTAIVGTAFMYATVSAAMHGMSRRLFSVSGIQSAPRGRFEKGARVLGHQLIDHVQFENCDGEAGQEG